MRLSDNADEPRRCHYFRGIIRGAAAWGQTGVKGSSSRSLMRKGDKNSALFQSLSGEVFFNPPNLPDPQDNVPLPERRRIPDQPQ